MAKKPNKLANDFELDKGFEEFDFDLSFDEPAKDTRTPGQQFRSGIVSGFTSTLKSEDFLFRQIKKSLPEGYGEAIDAADRIGRPLKNLYDESSKELGATLRVAKTAMLRHLPQDSKHVPKRLKAMMEKWRQEEKDEAKASEVPSREGAMQSTLREIFEAQVNLQTHEAEKANIEKKLEQGVERSRFKTMLELTNRTAMATSRLVDYQTKVTHKFQQRSLELQYRQLFAVQDLVKLTQESAKQRDMLLATVAKNTSLPDYVKLKGAEHRDLVFKNKLFDSMAEGVFGSRNRYIEKMLKGVGENLLGQIKGVMGGIREGVGMADMLPEDSEYMSRAQMGGEMVGGMAAEGFGGEAVEWAKRKLVKSKAGKYLDETLGVSKKGKWLSRQTRSLPNRVNEFKRNQDYGWGGSAKNVALGWLQSLLPGAGADLTIKRFTAADMDKPYFITRRTDRSLNEVIPGYLARIYREMQVMRTGNEKIELTRFDFNKGRFTGVGKSSKDMIAGLVDKDRKRYLHNDLDALMKMIDPEGKQSPEVTRLIRAKLVKNSTDTLLGNEKRLASQGAYGNSKEGQEATTVMEGFFKGLDEDKRGSFENLHNRLVDNFGDPRQYIQTQIDLGYERDLIQAGVINKKTNQINTDKLIEYYLHQERAKKRRGGSGGNFGTSGNPNDFVGPMRPNGAQWALNEATNRADDFLDGVKNRVKQAKNAAANLYNSDTPMQDIKSQAGSYLQVIKDKIAKGQQVVQDVYVRGETEPRIRAVLLKHGEYISKKTNKVIYDLTGIEGPIVDKVGNVVLTASEQTQAVICDQSSKTAVALNDVLGRAVVPTNKSELKASASTARTIMVNATAEAMSSVKAEYNKLAVKEEQEPADVYVEGEPTPRLTAVKMKLLKYFNKTDGSPIHSPADIKGDVGSTDSPDVLIQTEEIPKLRLFNKTLGIFSPIRMLVKLVKLLGRGIWWYQTKVAPKWAAWNLRQLAKVYKGVGKFGFNVLKSTANHAGMRVPGLNILKSAQDVMSKSTGEMLLMGRKIRAGEYLDVNTGKWISTLAEVTGEIRDKANQVVLSAEDFANGVVTANGEDIDFKKMAKDAAAGATAKLKGLGGKLKGALGAGFDKGLASAKNRFGNEELAEKRLKNFTPDQMLDRVKGSYEQMRKRFGLTRAESDSLEMRKLLSDIRDGLSGKEVRKNSFQDIMSRMNPFKKKKDGEKDKGERKSGGGVLGALGSVAGAIGSGIGAISNMASGGIGALAGSAIGGLGKLIIGGLGMGASGLVSAAGGAASLAGAAAGMAGTIASIVFSPAVLGAAAIGLAGYGVYKLYKHFTKGRLDAINKLRMVQYGYKPDDKENFVHALTVEQEALKGIKYDKAGKASIDYKKIRLSEMMEPYGLDVRDQKHKEQFLEWFKARFEPVFLTHMTALHKVSPDTELANVSDLKGELKLKYFEAVKFTDGPYGYRKLPYLPGKKIAVSTSSDVTAAIEAVYKESSDKKNKALALVPMAGAAAAAAKTAADGQDKRSGLGKMPQEGKEEKALIASGGSSISALMLSDGSKVTALDAIRFKAYGLGQLFPDKVRNLQSLETYLAKKISFDGKGKAIFAGNMVQTLKETGNIFGIGDVHSKQARCWYSWFDDRFLPIYLTYQTAMKARTGKIAEGNAQQGLLKPSQAMELANLLSGNSKAWKVIYGPWDNFALTTDPSVVADNISFLRQAADKQVMAEQKAKAPAAVNPTKPPAPQIKPNDPKQLIKKAPSLDAEPKGAKIARDSSGGDTTPAPTSVGMLRMAGGAISDGRNAASFLKLAPGVTLNGINPSFLQLFLGAVEEYGQATGRAVKVNDGFRTYEDQVAMKRKYGARAAEPGTSLHEFGLAMDVDPKVLNEMDKLGILRKYGLTRPVGQEPWHLEPMGIQMDLTKYKNNPAAANDAVKAGIGKGGGGLGTVGNARMYARSREFSEKIANASVAANDNSMASNQSPSEMAQAHMAKTGRLGFAARKPTVVAVNDQKYMAPQQAMQAARDKAVENVKARGITPYGGVDAESKPTPQGGVDRKANIPQANGDGYAAMKDTILASAKTVGVDGNLMLGTAAMESDFRTNAKAGTSSGEGPFQFIDETWDETISKYGRQYGYTPGSVSPTDVRASALMAAHYFKQNLSGLESVLGRKPGVTEAYMSHLFGPTGAKQFLTAMVKSPNEIAAKLFPKAAVKNKEIFYGPQGARTLEQVYQLINSRVKTKMAAYGIPQDGETMVASKTTNAQGMAANAQRDLGGATSLNTAYLPQGPRQTSTAANASTLKDTSRPMKMAAAYGMQTLQQINSTTPGATLNLRPTEDLLTKSVQVQMEMSDTLKKMFGLQQEMAEKMDKPSSVQEAKQIPTAAPAASNTYVPPRGSVNFDRMKA